MIPIAVFTFILVVLVRQFIINTNKQKRHSRPTNQFIVRDKFPKIRDEIVRDIDPTIIPDNFVSDVFDIFIKVQNAWENFDFDTLRKYTTDELYNMYNMQLTTLQAKNEKNIMNDFRLCDCYITNISTQNDYETIDVILETTFYDYVVDENNNVVRGSNENKVDVTYKLTFIKTLTDDINICPSCGATLENTASSICKYCRKLIVSDHFTYVLSKKENIKQKLL